MKKVANEAVANEAVADITMDASYEQNFDNDEAVANEAVANVVTVVVEATPAVELTETQKKAKRIIAIRFPEMVAHGLNFESRRSAVFTSKMEKLYNIDGSPKLGEDGTHVEKVVRRDLKESEIPTEAASEVGLKKAAAFVINADKNKEALTERRLKLEQLMSDLETEETFFDQTLILANEAVTNAELPQTTYVREGVTAKLKAKETENEKLRALLIAAGIDPDAN